jgi:hypothetical protein
MRKTGKRIGAGLLLLLLLVLLSGCQTKQDSQTKIQDLEYTLVPEEELPDELSRLIEEKKVNPFKLSYTAEGKLYIVVGYGSQETGGYSVTVNEVYLTQDAIVVDCDLLGPEDGEKVSAAVSYPYIVICMEEREESILFP